MAVRPILAGFLAISLGGCLSTPQPPDYRAALLRPCANASDWSPWLLVDAWQDGDVYKPETRFREDGVMLYAYGGQTYDNGKWSLEGKNLHFDTNNHYADYDGLFDGERASGTMTNKADNKGEWTLERACEG